MLGKLELEAQYLPYQTKAFPFLSFATPLD